METNKSEEFAELIGRLIEAKTPVSVNGMGSQSEVNGKRVGGGVILTKNKDYITVEFTKVAKKQEDTEKEIVHIPLAKIEAIGELPKKVGTLGGAALDRHLEKSDMPQ